MKPNGNVSRPDPARGRPNWRVRWRDEDGRSREKSFPRKVDADVFLTRIKNKMLADESVNPDAGSITFRDFAEEWRQSQVHRRTTAAKYETTLRRQAYPTLGGKPLRTIRPSHIQAWVKGLSATLAPSTVAVAHGIVASVFKSAVRDRLIASSPCEGIRLPQKELRPVVPLDTDTVQAIAAALPPRYRAMVTLAASTGLRQGEVFGLTVDRSGLQPPSARPTLTVDRQMLVLANEDPYLGPPKRRASRREIPLPRVAVEALAAHLAEFPAEPQTITTRDTADRAQVEEVALVFTNASGAPLRRNVFSYAWRKAVAESGAPEGTTFHDLRHYYASLLIRHGENVKVVQARLGHATAAETLDTYAHLWPDAEDRTRDAIDSVLGPAAGISWAAGASR